jgi:MFS family permease
MRFRGPLADSYPAAAVMVVCALVPYLVLTTAITPLEQVLQKDLGLSSQSLQLTGGMANAAYSFGTVLAVQLTLKLPVRRLLLLFASLFLVGTLLAAWAPTSGLFIAGRVTQGLTTGLMLIAAVPPLVIGWPKEKMPITAVVMNMGIFGAVAAGPIVGGLFAGAKEWRWLFWAMAIVGAVTVLFVLLTFEDQEPQGDEDSPIDIVGLSCAGFGCAATFFGASELTTHALLSSIVFIPLVAGILLIVAAVLWEYHTPRPLMPMRKLAHTIPVAGILTAMVAGAVSVALVDLALTALQGKGATPAHSALLFLPEIGGVLVAAAVFGAVFLTRFIPVLAFGGLLVLAGGAVVLTGSATGSDGLVLVGSGCIGIGAGASVSPALFMTGFSLENRLLPPVFAMVELLRGVAAFMTGPVLLHVAMTTGAKPELGLRNATWAAFGIAAVGACLVALVWAIGRARLQKPDVESWLEGEGPAVDSPPLAAALRRDLHLTARR